MRHHEKLTSLMMTHFKPSFFCLLPSECLLIFYETVFAVAQTEQFATSEEQENFVIPDQFPQDSAHANLIVSTKFLTGKGGVFVSLLHPMLLKSDLNQLITKVDKRNTRSMVTA